MSDPLPAIEAVTPWALPCVHGPNVRWHWDCPTCGRNPWTHALTWSVPRRSLKISSA